MPRESLLTDITTGFTSLNRLLDTYHPAAMVVETGAIVSVSTGIAVVSGLPGVGYDELVKFRNGDYGIAFNIDEDEVGVVLLGKSDVLRAGDSVERTGRVMDAPVGDALLGRVVDPIGRPLDGKGAVKSTKRLPIERSARDIMDRSPVNAPLQTGIIAIDALTPIRRGQRELILGDSRGDSQLEERECRLCLLYDWSAGFGRCKRHRSASRKRSDGIHDGRYGRG